MGPWIRAVKTQTQHIITTLRHDHRDADFEVGIVCYRDYSDKQRFKIVEFKQHIPTILQEIENLHAEGGGDDAEDVAGGLLYTQMLPWSMEADVKMVFHIADAPAHGMRYHEPEISDRFPQGDPQNINMEMILYDLSGRGIDYTFIKITPATDIMLRRFVNAYEGQRGKFMVTDLTVNNQQYRQLSDALTPTVIRSITQRISSQGQEEDLYTPKRMPDSMDPESSTNP